MKTILILFLLSLFFIAQSQTNVRMSAEPYGFWTMQSDTMQIVKTDKVVKLSLFVPATAVDSTKITGYDFTIDAIPSNGIIIPPGSGFTVGDKYAPIDSLTIEAWDKVWLMMLIDDN